MTTFDYIIWGLLAFFLANSIGDIEDRQKRIVDNQKEIIRMLEAQ